MQEHRGGKVLGGRPVGSTPVKVVVDSGRVPVEQLPEGRVLSRGRGLPERRVSVACIRSYGHVLLVSGLAPKLRVPGGKLPVLTKVAPQGQR